MILESQCGRIEITRGSVVGLFDLGPRLQCSLKYQTDGHAICSPDQISASSFWVQEKLTVSHHGRLNIIAGFKGVNKTLKHRTFQSAEELQGGTSLTLRRCLTAYVPWLYLRLPFKRIPAQNNNVHLTFKVQDCPPVVTMWKYTYCHGSIATNHLLLLTFMQIFNEASKK